MEISFALRLEERLSDLEDELRRIDTPETPSSGARRPQGPRLKMCGSLIRRWVS